MRLGYTKEKIKTQIDLLLTDNSIKLKVEDYHKDVITSFQEMYRFFIENRQALLTLDSPLVELFKQPIRFVFRNTRTYAILLDKILNPQFLRNGIEQSIQLDILSCQLIKSDTKPIFLPLRKIKKKALENMEIPLFSAFPDSNTLNISFNQTIDNFFIEPSCNRVIERIKMLNEDDLNQQLSFIRYSLYSRITGDMHEFSQSKHFDLNFIIDDIVPLTQMQLVKQAVKIALELEKSSLRSNENFVTCICTQYLTKKQCFQFQNIGNSLYDGSYGIALFLASIAKITLEERFRDLALGSLKSFLQDLENTASVDIFKEVGLGGAEGAGSIIYVLARIYQLLEEPVLLKDAKQVALLITSEQISTDTKFDVIGGTAGTILGLLALYRLSSDREILDLAIICGNYLLNNRVTSQLGYKTWASSKGRLLTGFSHGAAGITYALVKLYKITNETAFLKAAEEGIAYERSVFDREMRNWPDFRESYSYEKTSFVCSWCHGASGIGLARLGILDTLDSPAIREDIEAAIIVTKQQKIRNADYLCCGNLGRADFLLTASQKLSRPELLEDAIKIASQVVARAEQRGHFGYSSLLNFHPGFFQGASGIGYELLRLAYPDQLPSVLLWE
jgi:type 2 lantibiotic biosynthesis protein LanM